MSEECCGGRDASPSGRKRALWMCPYMPWPLRFGGTIRMYHLVRTMSREFDVDLVCLGHDTEVPPEVARHCRQVRVFAPDYSYRMAQAISLMLNVSHFRINHRSRELDAWLAQHGAAYDLAISDFTQMAWAKVPRGPFRVLDLHNIEHEVLARTAASGGGGIKSLYRRIDAAKLAREEMAVCHEFDMIAACSKREIDILGTWGLGATLATVPNGVDTEFFARKPGDEIPADVPEIVFIGTTHYFPNEQAVLHFHDHIWPRILERRPTTTFACVGGHPKPSVQRLEAPNFRIMANVPEIKPFYQGAKILAVPLLSGGGTRLKILEASAAGTPIVTTSLGCEGIDMVDGVNARIADEPDAFAAACVDALEDEARSRSMAEAARALVVERYDWNSIGAEFAKRVLYSMESRRQP